MGYVRNVNVLYEPVIKRPVILEFQCAYRVCDTLYGILISVREVVHRIDAPLVFGPVMASLKYPVDNGIPHVEVAAGHVYLSAQHPRALFKLTFSHPHKELQVFLNASVPEGRVLSGLCQRAPILPHVLSVLIINIGFACLDKIYRPPVKLIKVIRGVAKVGPFESEPPDIFHDGFDVLGLLFRRIRVVETKVALSAELFRKSKVKADRFRMPDVQIAVGFRRKSGNDALHQSVFKVFCNYLFKKVKALCSIVRSHCKFLQYCFHYC